MHQVAATGAPKGGSGSRIPREPTDIAFFAYLGFFIKMGKMVKMLDTGVAIININACVVYCREKSRALHGNI